MKFKMRTRMLSMVLALLFIIAPLGNVLAVPASTPDYIVTTEGGGTDYYHVLKYSNNLEYVGGKTKFIDAVALCKTDLNNDGKIRIHFGNQGNDSQYNEVLDIKPDSNTSTVTGPVTATYTGKLNIVETGFIAGSGLTVPAGVTITLDGLTLTNQAAKSNNITVWGTLTIIGTTNVEATKLEPTRPMINNQGTVNVQGGIVHTEKSRGINGGVINISGGKVSTNAPQYGEQAVLGYTVTISGGEIYGAKEAIRVGMGATTTISGGTIRGGNGIILIQGSTLNITGGTIDVSGIGIDYGSSTTAETNISISGGTVKGVIGLSLAAKGTTIITGGEIHSTTNKAINLDDVSNASDKSNNVTISAGTVVSDSNSAVYIGKASKSSLTVSSGAVVKSVSSNNTISLDKASSGTSHAAYASIFGTKIYNSVDGIVNITGKTGATGHEAAHKVIQEENENYRDATVTASFFAAPNIFLAWLYSVSPEETLNSTNGVTVGTLEDALTNKDVAKNVYLKVGSNIRVTFNMNYPGGVAPSAKDLVPGSTFGSYLPTNGITRTGYTFSGWYTQATGGTKVETSTVVSSVSSSPYTLYAHWTANSYTIIFDANGGSNGSISDVRATFDSFYGDLPDPGTKTGYTFDGWYTAPSGGTKVTGGTSVETADDHTLYAQWKGEELEVTFDANGGSELSSEKKTAVYGSPYGELPTVTPPTGQKFVGWYTAKENGDHVKSETIVATSSAQTLYAHWADLQVYSVSYSGNGQTSGTAPADTQYYEEESVTVPGNTGSLAKTGYEFGGWNTKEDGTGVDYEPGERINNSSVTLYAKWEAISVTAKFNVNADEDVTDPASISNKTVTFASKYAEAVTAVTRVGYKFLGWFTEQILPKSLVWDPTAAPGPNNEIDGWRTTNVLEYQVTGDTFVSNPSEHTLFAQWVAKVFKITYNTNSGTITDAVSGATAIYDKKYGQLKHVTRDGYTFDGWYLTEDFEEGTEVTDTTTVKTETAPILFAKWVANTDTPYTVERYQQDVTGDGYTLFDSETFEGTTDTTATASEILYTGFTEREDHPDRLPSTTIHGDGSTTLKLYYDRNIVTVTLISNGESQEVPMRFGSSLKERTLPQRSGYIFSNWYLDENFGTRWNLDTDTVTADTTLFAGWRPIVIDQSKSEQLTVDVETGNLGQEVVNKTPITRTTDAEGKKSDQVTFTSDVAKEAIQSIVEKGKSVARVVIPDPEDAVSRIDFTLPEDTSRQIVDANVNFELYTENVKIQIPASSLSETDEDLYFRLVPIKEETLRRAVEERARAEKVVISIAQGQDVKVVSRPMTIETNMQSRAATLVLPLRDVVLPTDAAEREKFLADLAIFVEHSDGEKELVKPQVVEYKPGLLGLQFDVLKFSTFTIINMEGYYENLRSQSKQHQPYINGYPDGTFKPDRSISRAEMAAILARNLNFDATKAVASTYPDLTKTHWAFKEIEFVKTTGLMVGDVNGYFRPNDPITRGEMAAIAASYKELDTTTFTKSKFIDVKESYWGAAQIEAVRVAGIFVGYQDNTYRPHNDLSRAEAVKIINRLFDRGPLYGVSAPSWPDATTTHWSYHEVEEASKAHNYIPRKSGGEDIIFLADK